MSWMMYFILLHTTDKKIPPILPKLGYINLKKLKSSVEPSVK